MVAHYGAMTGVSIGQPVVHAIGNDDSAQGMMAAMGAMTGVSIGQPVVYAMGNADSAQGMINSMSAYNGATLATTYVDVVTRTSTQAFANGGVVQEYASGGVVIRAGELGPEIAHFATGGTALIPSDGLYSVPAGTYISPNNAVSNSFGGPAITINVNGPVMGISDLTEQVMAELVPAVERATAYQRRQLGVRP